MAYNFPRTEVLVSTQVASNSTDVSFTSAITANFTTYMAKIRGMVPVTDATSLIMTWSTDNGGSYLSANYRYDITFSTTSKGQVTSSGSAATIILTTLLSNSTSRGFDMDIMFYDANSATRLSFWSQCIHQGSDNITALITTNGTNTGTTAITAIKFAMSSGNISTGTFYLYGIREP